MTSTGANPQPIAKGPYYSATFPLLGAVTAIAFLQLLAHGRLVWLAHHAPYRHAAIGHTGTMWRRRLLRSRSQQLAYSQQEHTRHRVFATATGPRLAPLDIAPAPGRRRPVHIGASSRTGRLGDAGARAMRHRSTPPCFSPPRSENRPGRPRGAQDQGVPRVSGGVETLRDRSLKRKRRPASGSASSFTPFPETVPRSPSHSDPSRRRAVASCVCFESHWGEPPNRRHSRARWLHIPLEPCPIATTNPSAIKASASSSPMPTFFAVRAFKNRILGR
jgi:hypothetical protein